jgi:diaminopimelate decarboxylase
MQFIRYRPPVLLVGEDGQTDVIRRGERIEDIKGPEELPARLKAEQ